MRPGDPPAPSLAFVVGLAVLDTVDSFAGPGSARLKWPNDVLVDTAKLAGILLERHDDAVVAGIGMNIAANVSVPGRATARLAALLEPGQAPSPALVLERLAARLEHRLMQWRGEGLAALLDVWQSRAHKPGEALAVTMADGVRLEGRYAGLTRDGALTLQMGDGSAKVISAGDVELITDGTATGWEG